MYEVTFDQFQIQSSDNKVQMLVVVGLFLFLTITKIFILGETVFPKFSL